MRLFVFFLREYTWKNFACNQTGRKVISIKDIVTDQSDQLDYPDRVIQIALGFNHLVTATVKQCFIHKLSSWNTPVTFDLKEGTISMILLSERYNYKLLGSIFTVSIQIKHVIA